MCFYPLQHFCGSSKTVRFVVLGGFQSYLNEPGFDLPLYFICRLFCLLSLSGKGPSHFLSMMSSLFFFLYGISTSLKMPHFTAQPKQSFCQETVSAEVAVKDARTRPDLCKNMTETNCDCTTIASCSA